jgi:hypothetical protein
MEKYPVSPSLTRSKKTIPTHKTKHLHDGKKPVSSPLTGMKKHPDNPTSPTLQE